MAAQPPGVINRSSQFCIDCKLVEGACCPVILATTEDVKWHWFQYQTLRHTAGNWLPAGLDVADNKPTHHTLHCSEKEVMAYLQLEVQKNSLDHILASRCLQDIMVINVLQ